MFLVNFVKDSIDLYFNNFYIDEHTISNDNKPIEEYDNLPRLPLYLLKDIYYRSLILDKKQLIKTYKHSNFINSDLKYLNLILVKSKLISKQLDLLRNCTIILNQKVSYQSSRFKIIQKLVRNFSIRLQQFIVNFDNFNESIVESGKILSDIYPYVDKLELKFEQLKYFTLNDLHSHFPNLKKIVYLLVNANKNCRFPFVSTLIEGANDHYQLELSIEIDDPSNTIILPIEMINNLLLQNSNIQRLSLKSNYVFPVNKALENLFSKIRSLSLFNQKNLKSIIENCPLIEYLKIYNLTMMDSFHNYYRIEKNKPSIMNDLFHHVFPKLKHLSHLSLTDHYEWVKMKTLLEFIEESQQSLCKLKLFIPLKPTTKQLSVNSIANISLRNLKLSFANVQFIGYPNDMFRNPKYDFKVLLDSCPGLQTCALKTVNDNYFIDLWEFQSRNIKVTLSSVVYPVYLSSSSILPLNALYNMSNLLSLKIVGMITGMEKEMFAIFNTDNFPQLKCVELLSDQLNITSRIIGQLVKNQNIQSLKLSKIIDKRVNNAFLSSVLSKNRTLQFLDFTNNTLDFNQNLNSILESNTVLLSIFFDCPKPNDFIIDNRVHFEKENENFFYK
ncbi:hypothetical protein DLAC_00704 [Tieghemostelium lacteum]|uniref:Uncharacterized protein n=1 Tax=Tieghemostelium lacteum TaxID=361077 RepID=A0A152A710_TIELA|nr:hypothetical protein DLAC_00704 [Tieghemostelium lacteum]|eukprot:KYR01915.1 hypothetical protein DLAC_00704 [Tieghemostelium lacteum]